MHKGWVLGSLSIIDYSAVGEETEALIWIYGEIFLWISLYVLFLDATETVNPSWIVPSHCLWWRFAAGFATPSPTFLALSLMSAVSMR